MLFVPVISTAQNINSDGELEKYLSDYAKESAKYQICGEYDRADIANIGIYFDEILSANYLKKQIKKHGSQEKAADAAVNKAQSMAVEYQHKLVEKGIPNGMCDKLLSGESSETTDDIDNEVVDTTSLEKSSSKKSNTVTTSKQNTVVNHKKEQSNNNKKKEQSNNKKVMKSNQNPTLDGKVSRKKQYHSSGNDCACVDYKVCYGPRGGRYCITSGGNKRYNP